MKNAASRPVRLALAAAIAAGTLSLAGCGSHGSNGKSAPPNQTTPGPPLPSGVSATIHPTHAPNRPPKGGPAEGGS